MILDKFKLTDKVAIITGAGKGIGKGIATAYAQAGAHVVCAARTLADVEKTAEIARSNGVQALAVSCDVIDDEQRSRLVENTLDHFGRIDILVNNAGGWNPKPALATSESSMEAAYRFNVISAFSLIRKTVPEMVKTAGGGAIVNISSRSGDMVQPSFVAYASAKAALNMMTRDLAAEFSPKVRINGIGVGGVDTDNLKFVLQNEDLTRQFNEGTPMVRPGQPEDIAAFALYLASPAASWVTGKIFQIDGGVEAPSITVPAPPL